MKILGNNLSFDETVRVAVNSVAEGLMDRPSAIKMIEDAAAEIVGDLESSLQAAVATLEKAVEEYLRVNVEYPLDEITLEDASNLYQKKDVLLYCRDGHAVAMFKEISEAANEPIVVNQ